MRIYGKFDESKSPIIYLKIAEFEPTDEEIEAYVKEYEHIINTHTGAVVIHDISGAKYLKSEHRIKLGEFLKRSRETMKKNLKGMVYVNVSVIATMVLKGIFLVSQPPIPYLITSKMEEGERWAREKMI